MRISDSSRNQYQGVIAISYGAMFIEGSLNVILVALMAVLSVRFGRSSGDIAILVSLKSLGTVLVLFFAGTLSDRYGRKHIIILGSLFFALFLLGFMVVDDYRLALFLVVIAGVGHGLMDSPAISLLFDALAGNTGPAMSFVPVFFSGGGVLTSILVSVFLRHGFNDRIIFLLALLLNLGVMILALKTPFPPVAHKKESLSLRVAFTRKPTVLREGVMLAVCALLFAFAQSILTTWLPTFASEIKGMTQANSVAILTVFQLGAVLGALVFSVVLRKHHTSLLLAINPLASVFIVGWIVFTSNSALMVCLVGAAGFFMGVYFSLCVNLGGELFAKKAGAATGAIGTASMLGGTVMVWLSGWIIDQVGVGMLFNVSWVMLILLTLIAQVVRSNYLSLKSTRRTL